MLKIIFKALVPAKKSFTGPTLKHLVCLDCEHFSFFPHQSLLLFHNFQFSLAEPGSEKRRETARSLSTPLPSPATRVLPPALVFITGNSSKSLILLQSGWGGRCAGMVAATRCTRCQPKKENNRLLPKPVEMNSVLLS